MIWSTQLPCDYTFFFLLNNWRINRKKILFLNSTLALKRNFTAFSNLQVHSCWGTCVDTQMEWVDTVLDNITPKSYIIKFHKFTKDASMSEKRQYNFLSTPKGAKSNFSNIISHLLQLWFFFLLLKRNIDNDKYLAKMKTDTMKN